MIQEVDMKHPDPNKNLGIVKVMDKKDLEPLRWTPYKEYLAEKAWMEDWEKRNLSINYWW